MADLLELSARVIDEGRSDEPVNRVTQELSGIAEGLAVVESFSHVVAFSTGEGLVLFDASSPLTSRQVLAALRTWSDDPIHSLVYTHGHLDHVGGGRVLVEEARDRGRPAIRVVGHENVPSRFARYDMTNGYNGTINARQFGRTRLPMGSHEFFRDWVRPDTTFRERLVLRTGELSFELRHARGETDDHLWAWVPERRAICAGDFFIWVFPNAGNPQKVQRYPLEWAGALREMAGMDAELFLPAHGLPIGGTERIRGVLTETAGLLESLVEQTLSMMNAGARLDTILHSVRVPDEALERPYLRPVYDEPEFIVHNIWRMYGGWYDGNPARLKPPSDAAIAVETAALAGGVNRLIERCRELAAAGDLRLACHLVELAAQAEPANAEAHRARAEIYEQRRKSELSLMARGIYGEAARDSAARGDA